jgi:hypothetical protein
MLLSAVSVLAVAQQSSEVPEGLMNYPVYNCKYNKNVPTSSVGIKANDIKRAKNIETF